ncbi:MAG: hypothetical protein ACRCY4_01110 [Brevinema sp.]
MPKYIPVIRCSKIAIFNNCTTIESIKRFSRRVAKANIVGPATGVIAVFAVVVGVAVLLNRKEEVEESLNYTLLNHKEEYLNSTLGINT